MNLHQLTVAVLSKRVDQRLHRLPQDVTTLLLQLLREPVVEPRENQDHFAKFFDYRRGVSPLHDAIAANDFVAVQREAEAFDEKSKTERDAICSRVNHFHMKNFVGVNRPEPSAIKTSGVGSPMHFAAFLGRTDMLAMLANQTNSSCSELGSLPLLFVACYAGHLDCVEQLLRRKDNGQIDSFALTEVWPLFIEGNITLHSPLSMAAIHGQVDIMHFLCQHGASVIRRDYLASYLASYYASHHPLIVSLRSNYAPGVWVLLNHYHAQGNFDEQLDSLKGYLDENSVLRDRLDDISIAVDCANYLKESGLKALLDVRLDGLQEKVKNIRTTVSDKIKTYKEAQIATENRVRVERKLTHQAAAAAAVGRETVAVNPADKIVHLEKQVLTLEGTVARLVSEKTEMERRIQVLEQAVARLNESRPAMSPSETTKPSGPRLF